MARVELSLTILRDVMEAQSTQLNALRAQIDHVIAKIDMSKIARV